MGAEFRVGDDGVLRSVLVVSSVPRLGWVGEDAEAWVVDGGDKAWVGGLSAETLVGVGGVITEDTRT